jgi:hypothetical protein
VARWGFFFRGASGDAVTSQSEIAALNEQHRACVRAIIGRIKFLEDFWRGKSAPAAERAGLVSAGYAISTLAVQFLKPYDHWPGQEGEAFPQEVTDAWAVQWYFNYLTAMRDHIKGLQDAVRNGELALRTISKAKAPEDEVQAWCSSAPWPKTPADARLFPECAHWDVMAAEWPDSIGLPSGGFDAEEWADWLAASKLVKKVGTDDIQYCPQAAQPRSEGLDYSRLATPTELVEAFRPFTGMEKYWFGDLGEEHPLRKARKVDGKPGRSSIEPLFDIIEVAQWLADKKPRFVGSKQAGKKVVWRVVQTSFPRAYAFVDSAAED